MRYIGIDLGTTNSVICSYDGQRVRVYKSPEQNDVTPSAIYVDKRGNRFFGQKAYNQAPYNPQNAATLFKRFMGTNIKIQLGEKNVTPEECSSEIIKVLFGYLPEELRKSEEVATVITVPAAFNQMKKDATLQAANLAGLGRVALMQEPVAAIMSIMQHNKQEGMFLVYDLGGGTFDISIAENIGGRVNLLSHRGIEMCGGRDLDRMVFNQIVVPWLRSHFSLPKDFLIDAKYKPLCRIAQWAIERAKIELSSREESVIGLSESEVRILDLLEEEIYLDIPLTRAAMNGLLKGMIEETVSTTRETLSKAGLTASDIERIVYVGGPTHYKPLRDAVTQELSIAPSIEVNPMTAVAEGAAIYAETIDWGTENHSRKASQKQVATGEDIILSYTSRTPRERAIIGFLLKRELSGHFVQITSSDTGWVSGHIPLSNALTLEVPLAQDGENHFSVAAYDNYGREINLQERQIVITRTLAAIGAIPASHAVAIEVMDKLNGTPMLDFLVNEGDSLPMKGIRVFRAGQTIKAGSSDSFNIKLWEGTIADPITDNRFIGVLKVTGRDLEFGTVPLGAEIECSYEITDSGNLKMEVSIPCIGATFGSKNFYSRQEGQLDFVKSEILIRDAQRLHLRIREISDRLHDDRLKRAQEKISNALALCQKLERDEEDVQKAHNELLEAKKLVSQTKQANLKAIHQMDLDYYVNYFNARARPYANETDIKAFEKLAAATQTAINMRDNSSDNMILELRSRSVNILWKEDWFVIEWFHLITENEENFIDRDLFEKRKAQGNACIANGRINDLRAVLNELFRIQIVNTTGEEMHERTNIVKG